MNGIKTLVNGQHITNGIFDTSAKSGLESRPTGFQSDGRGESDSFHGDPQLYTNGALDKAVQEPKSLSLINGYDQSGPENLQSIDKDKYLPIATLIRRSAQICWNDLSSLVDHLATIRVPARENAENRTSQSFLSNTNTAGDQSAPNLEKKDRLLNFANDQKANFIKLLVLLQWSKDVEDVSKTIELNFWLFNRRTAYWNVTHALAELKHQAIGFQVPNPDLSTAHEVLSLGKACGIPDIGYVVPEPLSSRKILHILRSLDRLLSIRLALDVDVPLPLQHYVIHNGRVTFTVPGEFELDLSLMDETLDSPFRVVDFRFTFKPSPQITEVIHNEVEVIGNSNIDRGGLMGCYEFFHDLSLSYKLAELHRQAIALSRTQWAGNLSIELLRRILVVQYWTHRSGGKSWIEIGIQKSKKIHSNKGTEENPSLHVRWLLDSKLVDNIEFELDESVLSIEGLLRQVIAQHTIQLLDHMYNDTVLTPLYAEGRLQIEQTSSITEPNECTIKIELSRNRHVYVQIEPVHGTTIISPVSERGERLQYEVNRNRTAAAEFASKILNFRCSLVEADVLAHIENTSWQILPSLKPSREELRAVFGGSIIKSNFFRQPFWSQDYSLAVTQSTDGDHWWLLNQAHSEGGILTNVQVIQTEYLLAQEEYSSAYFELLAEQVSGVIVLQSFAQHLKSMQAKYGFKKASKSNHTSTIPKLYFDPQSARLVSSRTTNDFQPSDITPTVSKKLKMTIVEISYNGIDQQTQQADINVSFPTDASQKSLEYLVESYSNAATTIIPSSRQILLRMKTAVGQSIVPDIIQRVNRLKDLITCIERIQKWSGLAIKSLTEKTLTFTYYQQSDLTLYLVVTLPTLNTPIRVDFLPHQSNPHELLAPQINRLLRVQQKPMALCINNILASLTMTFPILSYFQRLQAIQGVHANDLQANSQTINVDGLRAHVIVRQPSGFALQYFYSGIGHLPRDSVGPETHAHLLARFEIVPKLFREKTVWLVRPAIEEFQSYLRPSYSSISLRMKLKEAIFSRAAGSQSWLLLDSAAAVSTEKPEQLLHAIHDVMGKWVLEARGDETEDPVETRTASQPISNQPSANGNVSAKTTPKQNKPKTQQKSQPSTGKQVSNPMKNKEVISLD